MQGPQCQTGRRALNAGSRLRRSIQQVGNLFASRRDASRDEVVANTAHGWCSSRHPRRHRTRQTESLSSIRLPHAPIRCTGAASSRLLGTIATAMLAFYVSRAIICGHDMGMMGITDRFALLWYGWR